MVIEMMIIKKEAIMLAIVLMLSVLIIIALIKILFTDQKKAQDNLINSEEEMTGQVYQPFQMKISPVKKLMLYNFEKNPDEIYKGFELQYLEMNELEKGYIVIAYRNDDYVDVYVENELKNTELGQYEVCGNGLKNLVVESLGNPLFQLSEKGIKSAFQFKDIKDRLIHVSVEENVEKKSNAIDMIAPVGASSNNPVMFPAFAMYQFDFVTKKNSIVDIEIDGKKMIPDSFPVPIPKDGQMRYFTRYGYDCELVEFAPAGERVLSLENYEKKPICKDGVVAKYKTNAGQITLETLSFEKSKHTFQITFADLFPDLLRMKDGTVKGRFSMKMEESLGDISGEYTVCKEKDKVTIVLQPSEGWNVKNKTLFTKLLFQKKSFFRTWPESYRYTQKINLTSGQSESTWERI